MLDEFWSDLRYRLRAVFRRAAVEHELDDELRFHIEREADKYVAQGVPRDEAVRRARLAFGGVSRIKDDTRDARGVTFLEHVMQDVRYALRGLRTRPLFTAVVVATLALGVGVNAAMFGIIDRVIFRAPAYLIDPGSVNRVFVQWAGSDGKRRYDRSLAYPQYTDIQKWNRTLASLAAFAYRRMAVGEGDATLPATIGVVTPSYFDFFDAKPAIGRFFDAHDDALPAGNAVAVLGYDFWLSRYGGHPDAIGKQLKIDKTTFTIVGVAPRGFQGVSDQEVPAAFIPLANFGAGRGGASFSTEYGWTWLELLGRRKRGVSVAEATADLTNAFVRSWNVEAAAASGVPAAETVRPIAVAAPLQLARGPMAGPATKVMRWIGGVALIVLLIACANVANLLLARALRRRREMAVRRAIGGSRARLVQQILTETSVLAAFGTIAGLAAAQLLSGALRKLIVRTEDAWPVVTDGRTMVFAIGLAAVTALLAGLVPALHAGRSDLADSLKAGTRDAAYRSSRLRTTLLLVQTALSVVLLVGAGLFVRSLREVKSLPLGYDLEHLLYVETEMRDVKLDTAGRAVLVDQLLSDARALPGVEHATLTVSVPFYSSEGHGMYVEGIDSVRKLGRFELQSGNPEYFATTGTRILQGRAFDATDVAGTPPVAVISDGMAKAVWKTESALGKCFRIAKKDSPCITVIGIAENIKARSITKDGQFNYYLPMAQYIGRFGPPPELGMFVRARGRPEASVEALRSRLQRSMPGSAFVVVHPFHELVDPQMQSWSSGAQMFLAFGVLALVLAAIGLYAVIAFGVAQRTQELGVRIALGAQSRDVLRLVVGEGVKVTLGGVLAGALIARYAGRGLDSLLYGVTSRDPLVYAIVAATLIVVGVLASALPATRATRVDPNVALRAE